MNKNPNNTELDTIKYGTATLNLGKGTTVTIDSELLNSCTLSDAFKTMRPSSDVCSIQTLTDLDGTVDKRFFLEGSSSFIQVVYDEDDLSHLRRSLKLWVLIESPIITTDSEQEESIRNLLADQISLNGHLYERVNRLIQYEFLSVEYQAPTLSIEQQYNSFERYINDEYDVEEIRCVIDASDKTGKISYWVGIEIEPEDLSTSND
ncbi:DUF2491 family protein [Vibrio coralliirubri]|uniref:DUF2491 family protein n=1 Tax=Vibrio coralliirubri TaxID=1516159 RepID=UPI0022840EE9|nr:DUF2491 family protein [Vibrio coralliirubri]MCY9861348.1 DUF2491 family protein [Vibrio coralliirubri]